MIVVLSLLAVARSLVGDFDGAGVAAGKASLSAADETLTVGKALAGAAVVTAANTAFLLGGTGVAELAQGVAVDAAQTVEDFLGAGVEGHADKPFILDTDN